eukprot:maker-scaffold34_size539781-snap-gene-3.20 protein:Tk05362 transcript:maker-scaffold34_size539781-snap-gene-3.20-mRNA-1 annotation:"mannan endo- -beta-mannosidase"
MKEEGGYVPPLWTMVAESVSSLMIMINFSGNFLIYCSVLKPFKQTMSKLVLHCQRPSSLPELEPPTAEDKPTTAITHGEARTVLGRLKQKHVVTLNTTEEGHQERAANLNGVSMGERKKKMVACPQERSRVALMTDQALSQAPGVLRNDDEMEEEKVVLIEADVEGKKFTYAGQEVFLSGTNAAWFQYGNDFGNGQWDSSTGTQLTKEMKLIGDSGGNSVRVWVHVEGEFTPQFDSNGYVSATDGSGTLISDLRKLLDVCQSNGVFLIPVLWNGAVMRPQKYKDLFTDTEKLRSYLDNALTPMVEALKDHPALGAWEIMNEPEGSIQMAADEDACYDTTHLDWTRSHPGIRAPGWSGGNIGFRNMLKFINRHASAILQADPKALVTVGSWSEWSQTDSDQIQDDSVHNFWQIHTYPYNSQWDTGSPFQLSVNDYDMDAPLVIGEFPVESFEQDEGHTLPNGDSTEDLVEYLYGHGYNGGWSWSLQCDTFECGSDVDMDVLKGLEHLKGRTDHGQIDIDIN